MQDWTSKYTCPAWMCVVRKPHPFGNERHTIDCGLSTIMWFAEIVDGGISLVITEDLILMILARQWEQLCRAQRIFETVQRWLLWIVASMLQRV